MTAWATAERTGDWEPAKILGMGRMDGCDICHAYGPDVPVFFASASRGGAGRVISSAMYSMALAYRYNMSFGGNIPPSFKDQNPMTNMKDTEELRSSYGALVQETFGLSPTQFFPFMMPTSFDLGFGSVPELESMWEADGLKRPGRVAYLLSQGGRSDEDLYAYMRQNRVRTSDWYLSSEFLTGLRRMSRLGEKKLDFAPGRPSVAMHVRYGGGVEKDSSFEWCFDAIDYIKESLPNADIHVFSKTSYDEGPRMPEMAPLFDGFVNRSATVHLDDDDLASVWAHMARADVLVTAKSSFSHVPALLSTGCVVHQNNLPPLEAWMDGEARVGQTEEETEHGWKQFLQACINKQRA